jgi:hypothetical protein
MYMQHRFATKLQFPTPKYAHCVCIFAIPNAKNTVFGAVIIDFVTIHNPAKSTYETQFSSTRILVISRPEVDLRKSPNQLLSGY